MANQIQGEPVAPEPIFALDIGTRSIIGVVGVPEGDLLRVMAVERMEHPKRAMIDGQIEDIEQTARVAGAVKARLEKRLGVTLRDVCVAAAGRALKTQRAEHEKELDPKEAITTAMVGELEMEAVQKAYEALGPAEDDAGFYCVGYTATRYLLDDYPLSTLQGHKGKRVSVSIIATFLPNAVVESLYTTMAQTGLAVSSLTLEPIAAMNAIIPKELRLLNLALVDIGAGTSDIAISRDGSVAAYTMATVAGDEVTEAIIREYLVDFQAAEEIKLALGVGLNEIKFHDILGLAYSVPPKDILERVTPAIEGLADTICSRILEANGQAPAAVFLVGGGSQLPGLCALVADRLSIDRSKVAVGSNNYMKRAVVSEEDVSGPEFATPMGIAITAMLARERDRFSVRLNGEDVPLVRSGTTSVMDVLLFCGYKHSQIIGRSGQSVTFEYNGEKRTVRGALPTAATLTVNGRAASLSTPLQSGDSVEITPAVSGEDAAPTLGSVVGEWKSFTVRLNGETKHAGTAVFVNGESVTDPQRPLRNLDVVLVREVRALGDFLRENGVAFEGRRLYVGDVEREEGFELSPGDEVGVLDSPLPEPEASAARETPRRGPMRRGLTITLNGETVALMQREDGASYQFVDMLNFVDIDPTKPQGNIVLLLNGQQASYLDTVRDGDRIEIYWDGSPGENFKKRAE